MKLSRLNKYREIGGMIKKDNEILMQCSKYMYEDPRFPAVIQKLSKTKTGIEKYRDETFPDVGEFLAAAVFEDVTTGYVMKAYYHDSLSWDQIADNVKISASRARKLAMNYVKAKCE